MKRVLTGSVRRPISRDVLAGRDPNTCLLAPLALREGTWERLHAAPHQRESAGTPREGSGVRPPVSSQHDIRLQPPPHCTQSLRPRQRSSAPSRTPSRPTPRRNLVRPSKVLAPACCGVEVRRTHPRNDGLTSRLPVGSSSHLQGNPQAFGEKPFQATEPPGFVGQIATSDQAILLVALGAQTPVLLLWVVAHSGPGQRDVMKESVFGEAGPQVGVHAQFHLDVQAAYLLIDSSTPERGWLREVVVVVHPDKAVIGDLPLETDRTAIRVYPEAVTVDHLPIGMLNEDLGHLLQGAGFEQVVGAQPAQDVAARPVEPLYQRVGLPFVWFAHPVSQLIRVLLEDLYGVVGRSTVHNDVLQVGITLIEHALDRRLDVLTLVERRRHHRYLRPISVIAVHTTIQLPSTISQYSTISR